MKWRKLGRVYQPDGALWWARTHAFLPTAYYMPGGPLRIYYTGLDEMQFGRVGFVDLDPTDPTRILGYSREPVLDLGSLGAFDDSGVNASAIVKDGSRLLMYYIGWQRSERVPYMLFSGLADSPDGTAPFQRRSRVPVLDRTEREPYSRSAPYVLREGGRMRMWYWTCVEWTREGDWVHYNNVIMHAQSVDGVTWVSDPTPCITVDFHEDYSAGRPWVMRDGTRYRMWYAIRGKTAPYRIGYAESADGCEWVRMDADAGIDRSAHGWDSEMICYPSVVDVGDRRFLVYNGNGHGKTGFGVAELVG